MEQSSAGAPDEVNIRGAERGHRRSSPAMPSAFVIYFVVARSSHNFATPTLGEEKAQR